VPDADEPLRKPKKSLGLSARLPSVQVTPDLLAELEQAAQQQGVSVAAAVRASIRMWLDAAQKKS
jgi:hypothetical protein